MDKGGKDDEVSQSVAELEMAELELQEIAKEADAEMVKGAVARQTMFVPYTKPHGDPIQVKFGTGKSAIVLNSIKPFLLTEFLQVKGKMVKVKGSVGELRKHYQLSSNFSPRLVNRVTNPHHTGYTTAKRRLGGKVPTWIQVRTMAREDKRWIYEYEIDA